MARTARQDIVKMIVGRIGNMRWAKSKLRARGNTDLVRERIARGRNAMTVNRRSVIKGALAAGVATQVLKVPAAPAQAAPWRVGFLTIKTGPLASGGLQMEQGLTVFFKERNNTLAGRPVELHTADTAGNPAQARTKTQELVERLNVAVLI